MTKKNNPLKTQNSKLKTSNPEGNKYLNMDLLRFTTAGSVDDGKSKVLPLNQMVNKTGF